MAWKTFLKNYSAGQQAVVFADWVNFVENSAGWTLHDDISATQKVFVSSGESGSLIPGYLEFTHDATYMYIYAWTYWDNVAHVGYGRAYSLHSSFSDYRKQINTAGVKQFFGNKDILVMRPSDATRSLMLIAGHFNSDPFTALPVAEVTALASAGTPVTIAVDNTDGFQINVTNGSVIVDPSTGMRQPVTVTGINPGVSVTVASLVNDYTAGSKIGWHPLVFGIGGDNYDYWQMTAGTNVTGDGPVASWNSVVITRTQVADLFSPINAGLYSLNPIETRAYGPNMPLSILPSYIKWATGARLSIYPVNDNKIFQINTASGGSASTLVDAAQTWTINEHAGKSCVIVSGTGSNQSRVIASNTADTLTLRDDWATNPVSGSNYMIADRTYISLRNHRECIMENEE